MEANKNKLNLTSVSADGLDNPFARGGIQRSPPSSGKGNGTPVAPTASTPDTAMNGPSLIKAVGEKRDMLPKVVAASQQLDAIIEFVAGRSTLAKDLKHSLLMLRSTMRAATKEHAELEARVKAATKETEKAFESRSAQTDACPSMTDRPVALVTREQSNDNKASTKRARQSPGEETPTGPKKRLIAKGKPTEEHEGNKKQSASDNQWKVVRKKEKKKKEDRAPPNVAKKKRGKGDALILKTEGPKYSEVLKTMRGDDQLKGLGADVRSIRRSRTGDMILELKKDATMKGSAYKVLAEKVLGDSVQIRALTPEMTLQLKNLDEITEAGEVARAFKEQSEVVVTTEAVRLRKGPAGTQVATIRLPLVDGIAALKVAKLKVGWSVCPLSVFQQPDVCFRCFERGHKSWNCKGPDRSQLCRRCGEVGHKAKDCSAPPRCLICFGQRDAKHITGGLKCPAGASVTKTRA